MNSVTFIALIFVLFELMTVALYFTEFSLEELPNKLSTMNELDMSEAFCKTELLRFEPIAVLFVRLDLETFESLTTEPFRVLKLSVEFQSVPILIRSAVIVDWLASKPTAVVFVTRLLISTESFTRLL